MSRLPIIHSVQTLDFGGRFKVEQLDLEFSNGARRLYERMPAPFGLIRYGVAPDHPRIKGIITALHKVLDKPQVRLLGNVDYGTDITAIVQRRNFLGTQFHPERSGPAGARVLQNFLRGATCC